MPKQNRSKYNRQKPEPWDMKRVLEHEVHHLKAYSGSSWGLLHSNHRFKWMDLTIRTVEASLDIASRNIMKDLFTVFTLLGTRFISHHQAIFGLLQSGHYGEVTALHRMLLETTDLITYFYLHPEDASIWLQWSAQDPAVDRKKYRSGLRQFSHSKIQREIKKDVIPLSAEYPRLSTAIHPNVWGMQFYSKRPTHTQPNIELQFGPNYDARIVFRLGSLANRTLPHPIFAFLQICHQAHAPKSTWRSIQQKYESYLPEWESLMKVDAKFDDLMDETERRLSSGEPWEQIQREIKEKYNLPNLEGNP